MTRAIPRFDIDLLVLLSDLRREEGKNYGRWDQKRRDAHIRKLKRTARRKWREKQAAKGPKPYDGNPRAAIGLSIQEKILCHLLPGEWLSSTAIARRAGLTHREVSIKIRQQLAPKGMVLRIVDPNARIVTGRMHRPEDRSPIYVNALTPLGCAVRADRLMVADLLGAPKTMPPPEAKIPEKFLESFGIDFSPYFETHLNAPGTDRRTLRERQRAAAAEWARRATQAGVRPDEMPGQVPVAAQGS